MSTITQSLLVPPVQLTAADAMYYTVPTGTSVKIGRAVFMNTDTAARTVTINVNTGTSSAANEVMVVPIAAGATYVSPELAGLVLPPGYQIRGLADTAAKVNIIISGITIVG